MCSRSATHDVYRRFSPCGREVSDKNQAHQMRASLEAELIRASLIGEVVVGATEIADWPSISAVFRASVPAIHRGACVDSALEWLSLGVCRPDLAGERRYCSACLWSSWRPRRAIPPSRSRWTWDVARLVWSSLGVICWWPDTNSRARFREIATLNCF